MNQISNKSDTFECLSDELDVIKDDLDENNEFYLYQSTPENKITQLTTLTGQYSLLTEYNEVIREFRDKYDLNQYRINHIKNNKISQFILENTNKINSINLIGHEDPPSYNHIDMEKSYTRSKSCHYYEGFLGNISNFEKCDDIQSIGIYLIKNIQFSHNPKSQLLKKMRFML